MDGFTASLPSDPARHPTDSLLLLWLLPLIRQVQGAALPHSLFQHVKAAR